MFVPSLQPFAGVGPTGLWQHLGDLPGKPWVPLRWEAECYDAIKVPWPGLDPSGKPYPTIFGINTGRRAGKTTTMEKLLWKGMLAPDDQFGPPVVRVTADTEEHGYKCWDKFLWHLYNTPLNALLKDHSKERNLVVFHNGANAQLISANNPAALAGDGVTLWLVDEAQYLSQAAYDNLFPSTAERNGVIVMFGVSEGSGPFREVCIRGDNEDYPEYLRLSYPTSANPFVPKWRIELAERMMLPHVFKSLYLAQWEGELGKIFRNVDGCLNNKPVLQSQRGYFYTEPYRPNHEFVCGIDLGRLSDWSVITIWTLDGELVAWDRFNIVDWQLQKARFKDILAEYSPQKDVTKGPRVCLDATGIGDPVHDDLTAMGIRVADPYAITTNARKRILVDDFAIRVGAGDVSFPKIPLFIEELQDMEAKKSKAEGSNVITYSATSGKHDDFVLSACFGTRLVPKKVHFVSKYNYDESEMDEFYRERAEYRRQVAPWEAIT
jgi:hypothetical protein